MRHDKHFVEELGNHSVLGIGFLLPIDRIEANRQQPRTTLGDLTELTASIQARGVLEPLLVRRRPGSSSTYELIAGERRFHAALEAGLEEVPCIELQASDQEALEIALVENLQRKDLTPFEEAEGFRTLVEGYGYTHEHVAAAIGKSRTTVTEALKLLVIPPAIRDLCRHADITAKSVLLLIARAQTVEEMASLVDEIASSNLDRESARQLAAGALLATTDPPDATRNAANRPHEPSAGHQVQPPASSSQHFKPIQIRFKPEGGRSPVHLALSIRQAGVSREDIVRTLEALIARLRSGDLDDRLQRPDDRH